MAEPQTQCPKCANLGVVQRSRDPDDLFVWVAAGWIDPDDGREVEIEFCPWCGAELLDSDEYGELPPSLELPTLPEDELRARAELIAELGAPSELGPPSDEWGDDPRHAANVDIGRRHTDGYFHHKAIVGMIPSGHGFIYQWGGDAMVEGQFLPEFMQPRVNSGDVVRIRCHEPGRFVAFIRCDDGQAYCVGFNRSEPPE